MDAIGHHDIIAAVASYPLTPWETNDFRILAGYLPEPAHALAHLVDIHLMNSTMEEVEYSQNDLRTRRIRVEWSWQNAHEKTQKNAVESRSKINTSDPEKTQNNRCP